MGKKDKSIDIKYRGPLGYRELRIIGWIALALAQIGTLLAIASKLDPSIAQASTFLAPFLKIFSNLMMPLFLIAAFALILDHKNSYKSLIIKYGALSLLMFVGFVFVYEHYLIGTIAAVSEVTRAEASQEALLLLSIVGGGKVFSFNIFIDLFLCTLFGYFIMYHPTKYFQGKKIILFRLLSILPIIYEVASIVIKLLIGLGKMSSYPYLSPFLTTKPPVVLLVFIALTLFIKTREYFYVKKGRTVEQYNEYLNTNRNSLHFSIFLTVALVIAIILDVILLGVFSAIYANSLGEIEDALVPVMFIYKLGFGQSVPLIFAIPFILLFSYTKTYKNKRVDMFIPVAGIGIIAFIFIEGFFLMIRILPQLLENIGG